MYNNVRYFLVPNSALEECLKLCKKVKFSKNPLETFIDLETCPIKFEICGAIGFYGCISSPSKNYITADQFVQ